MTGTRGATEVAIDIATTMDLDAVTAIEALAFSDPWSREAFASTLRLESGFFACARSREGAILGYVVAWFAAGEGEIANLAVATGQRGQGIGARLLDAALTRARAERARVVYLEVRDSNDAALRLYRSRDFSEVGRRRGYYRKPAEDAIVLRLSLTDDT